MKITERTSSIIALIVANLIPLAGVALLNWDAAFIVLLYWAENIVVGFYNILKMVFLKVYSEALILELLFFIPFFCLHYGAFCAGHGALLLSLFFPEVPAGSLNPDASWPGPLAPLQVLFGVVASLWSIHPPGMEWPVMCLFLSHGVSFFRNYLGEKEYHYFNAPQLMIQPYKRILILQAAVIAGALPIRMCGSPVPVLCLLVLFKTAMDIFLHLREHRLDHKRGIRNGAGKRL